MGSTTTGRDHLRWRTLPAPGSMSSLALWTTLAEVVATAAVSS